MPRTQSAKVMIMQRKNPLWWCPLSHVTVDATGARQLTHEMLATIAMFCACGDNAQNSQWAWLLLHSPTPKRQSTPVAEEYALVFPFCDQCRDTAHCGACVAATTIFQMPPHDQTPDELTLHVTYEALCAARFRDETLASLSHLTRLRVHPYTISKRGRLSRDLTWRDLRTEHHRCAAPQCGDTRDLTLRVFTMVYGVDGESVTVTIATCTDSSQCTENVRQEMIAGMGADVVCAALGGDSKPQLSDKTCKVCNTHTHSRCDGCKEVRYCSVECQRVDWRTHKKRCRIVQRLMEHEAAKMREAAKQ